MNLVDAPPRETAVESGGYVKGVAVALVTQNSDDEGEGRVKVSYPWFDESESHWARLATPMAGNDRGLVLIPEVGDEVLVAFERGDLRFPYVIGSLWNGQDKPPFDNADGNNDRRLLQSRSKHYLLFDDGTQGSVELAHVKGRKVVFDETGWAVQDENGNTVKVDSTSGAMTIETKGDLTIKGMKVTIEAVSLQLKASGVAEITGALVKLN